MKTTDVHTLIIGSGTAGLNAALQLKRKGIDDILILTEGLQKGTSINTGSDKQTYYKMSLCGSFNDSPVSMARVYYDGGGTHGDIALVESAVSLRAFMNLVDLGVPFPTDTYGQYIGYKTDHDPTRRATSIGPYTSREMCRALIQAIKQADIPVLENRDVIELITVEEKEGRRAAGAIVIGKDDRIEIYRAENVIFAVGGPAGIYDKSVYPGCHTGAIGLALRGGAAARNLPLSQFGLASTAHRWNVSGTYMQVIPRFISRDPGNEEDEKEFLSDYFDDPGRLNSMVFLKGYQWPFDAAKAVGGSSIIDILVYIETVIKGRKVYLDFTDNPKGFSFAGLSDEARIYLDKSEAQLGTPIKRLKKMNPGALTLYLDNNIDLETDLLEIAVCSQHNNGGLAADIWWQSENIRHLFPVGEANGSHGVYRPGGSALNSGQVGGYRAAEYISVIYSGADLDVTLFEEEVEKRLLCIESTLTLAKSSKNNWKEERRIFQKRMSESGAFIRTSDKLKKAIADAREQVKRVDTEGSFIGSGKEKREYFRNRQLCFSHLVYLEAILFSVESGTGSRGSALIIDRSGEKVDESLDDEWCMIPENRLFRDKIQQTLIDQTGSVSNSWIDRRDIPESELWFETVWQKYKDREIYK